jgi:hypothetical protein
VRSGWSHRPSRPRGGDLREPSLSARRSARAVTRWRRRARPRAGGRFCRARPSSRSLCRSGTCTSGRGNPGPSRRQSSREARWARTPRGTACRRAASPRMRRSTQGPGGSPRAPRTRRRHPERSPRRSRRSSWPGRRRFAARSTRCPPGTSCPLRRTTRLAAGVEGASRWEGRCRYRYPRRQGPRCSTPRRSVLRCSTPPRSVLRCSTPPRSVLRCSTPSSRFHSTQRHPPDPACPTRFPRIAT